MTANGAEGETDDPDVLKARERDLRALLATLFASRGAVMLTAGDEFGRSQGGNNNAYAQDNEITWLDWNTRDTELEAYVAELSALRRRIVQLADTRFLTGEPSAGGASDVEWLKPDGSEMTVADWEDPEQNSLVMLLAGQGGRMMLLGVLVNGSAAEVVFSLPEGEEEWSLALAGAAAHKAGAAAFRVAARSVAFVESRRDATGRQSHRR
jgi:glycogen debranching enzyme